MRSRGAATCVVFAYVLFAGQQASVVGYFVGTTMDSRLSIDIPAWIIVIAPGPLVTAIARFDASSMPRLDTICEGAR